MHYLALGDSYTIGEAVPPEARWPAQLAARLAECSVTLAPPEILARTGWTTGELAAAIAKSELRDRYDLVSLLIGVNDQYRRLPAAGYREGFRALLAVGVAHAGGNPRAVLVLSIPDWGVTPFAADRDAAAVGREIDVFNAIARDETLRVGARWVDVTPVSRSAARDPTLVAGDGLHPSAEMYRRWVELALPEARAALERGTP